MAWRRNAAKLYRALLFAYPAEFRREYGAEMERLFDDRLHLEPRVRVWLDAIADIAVTAPVEHAHVLAADLRHGGRFLDKSPAFTAMALLAMALGSGASTAVISLVNAVLIRSLPYGDAGRLVYVWTPNEMFQHTPIPIPLELTPSNADFYDWQRSSRSFASLTMFFQKTFTLSGGGAPARVGAAKVTGNFFATLESRPELGRTIADEDYQPGRAHVAVIADGLWQSQFGRDPNVLGRSLRLNREVYKIVGVMPKEFVYPRQSDLPLGYADIQRTEVWIPLALTPAEKDDRANSHREGIVVGRLRPGSSLKRAQAEMSAIAARLDPLNPADERGWKALVRSFVDTALGPLRPQMALLLGAVAFVLLIACGNVANLLLARAAGRVHEMGVRSALGAERARLIRQLLTESLLLAIGGGALGVALAAAAIRVLVRFNPGDIPRIEETSLDGRVLLFTLAVSLLTGFAFGIVPALSSSRVRVAELLNQGGARGPAGQANRFRHALIVSEAALAVILLSGAGLLIRSYWKLEAVDPGFAPSTLTMQVALDARYDTAAKHDALFRALFAQARALPGVRSIAAISHLPFSQHESASGVEVKGFANKENQWVDSWSATPGYFETMRIPLIDGRFFDGRDLNGRPPAAIVNRAFEKVYFPGHRALGGQLRFGADPPRPWMTIVGVVGDIRHSKLEEVPRPAVYTAQSTGGDVVVAVDGSTEPVIAAMRTILRKLDPALALGNVATMNQLVAQANARRRFQTLLLAVFAAGALFLALVGLYGLMAYAVKRRTAEIGLRMALGASRARVLGMVIGQGARFVAFGIALGLAGSLALTRLMSAWLYGVSPYDPVTLIGVPLSFLAVSLAACLIPAWKAMRIDPVNALRHE